MRNQCIAISLLFLPPVLSQLKRDIEEKEVKICELGDQLESLQSRLKILRSELNEERSAKKAAEEAEEASKRLHASASEKLARCGEI